MKYKKCIPFWNDKCLQTSKKIWLPNCNDINNIYCLLSNQSNKYIKTTTNLTNNSYNNSIITTVNQDENTLIINNKFLKKPDNKIVNNSIRSRKIRIYPNKEQSIVFKKWFDTSRYVYNKSLNHCKVNNKHESFQTLRNLFVTHKSRNGVINKNLEDFELETPKEIRAEAIRDLSKAVTVCFSQLKQKIITKFDLKYKSRKNNKKTITIAQSGIRELTNNSISIYLKQLKTPLHIDKRTTNKEWFRNLKINHDIKLTYDGIHYDLIIPIDLPEKNNIKDSSIIALDPGCRTFQTGFSSKEFIEVTHNKKLIDKLRKRVDYLKSLRDSKDTNLRHSKKKILKTNKKIRNHIDGLHWSTITYLTKTYSSILLPSFENQGMQVKSNNKTLNRDLGYLRHYTFKERLLSKASLTNTKVYIVDESYTSQTCSSCGLLNDVKDKKIYNCSCGLVIDRDVNASRNILIKYTC